jgi:PAS domain S-box-containing protein
MKDENKTKFQLIDELNKMRRLVSEFEKSETTLKQAKELLKDEVIRRRILVEQSRDGIVVIDQNGKVFEANQRFADMLGYSSEELLQLHLWDWDFQWTKEQLLEMAQTVNDAGDHFETRHRRKDGTIYDVEISTNGAVCGGRRLVFCICRDITERKQAEEALKESEDRFRTIIDNLSDGVFAHDLNGNFVLVNRAALKNTGYTENEIMNLTVADVDVNSIDRDDLSNIWMRLNKGELVEIEAVHRRKEGSHYPVELHLNRISLGNKPVVLAVARDITERKKAEESLKSSHERFLAVLDSIDAHVFVSDLKNYQIMFMNKRMIEDFGDDFTGKLCWSVFRNDVAPCAHCTNDQLLDDEGKPTEVCVWQAQNPVTGKWYIHHDRAIMWTDGRFVKLQIATDITKIKKIEEELRQAHKMEAIGTLAGGIAHDFNNILSAVLGYTELALDDVQKGSMLEENLQEVFTAGKRAKSLVKQILTFARQTDDKVKPVRVSTIAREAIKFLRSSIPANIKIKENIQSNSLTMGSPTSIHQIFINLCTNAAHAMEHKGGLLEVSLTDVNINSGFTKFHKDLKPGAYLMISVSDTGTGISPDIIKSVFEPYFTTKAPGEGTGMGLALVHGIVKGYEGEITVRSEIGSGTVFKIYLPVTKRQAEKSPYQVDDLPVGNERILFVDDEAPIARMGSRTLERLGYIVTTRTSSVEAFELFRSKPNDFDVVITDMTMPNMTGDELASELMAIRPDIPVILCTGYSKKISDENAADIGIKAFAYKPVVKADLAKTVRKVLDEARS